MPQENNEVVNNTGTVDLDDFLDNLGNDENNVEVENVQENNKVVEAPVEKVKAVEVKPVVEQKKENKPVKKDGNKLYTQEEVNDIMTRRLARFKFDAVELTVDERTQELTERLEALENERNNAIRESTILRISKETGIDTDILGQTKLEGDDLKTFANALKEKSSSWAVKTSDLENAVLSGTPKEDELDDFYRTLMGDK